LSREGKMRSLCLYRALKEAENLIKKGERDVSFIEEKMRETVEKGYKSRIDYLKVLDAGNLKELKQVRGRIVIAGAVFVEGVRLIDNIVLSVD
ncbi:MAG: pantoate--beta-alanine ligase, partial [Candidatus Omnitrophica bacterium]|nr:pantoate--beta-alanine ligase [Candidatus Omnitrophota bacterium]MBD3269068.1 pantoate--beta-alanine ligase [Candidatus Omnitrophota bacterium]